MDNLHSLELVSSIFAMGGSFFLSQVKIKEAMSVFMVGNALMSVVAISMGLLPLLAQLSFFTAGGIWTLIKIDKTYAIKFIVWFFFFSVFLYILNSPSFPETVTAKIGVIEIMAATFAVIGNFLMGYGFEYKKKAFLLFILADILYVGIGLENGLFFFTIQTVYFLAMSVMGIKKLNSLSVA